LDHTIGIIGGISPESTIEYYQLLLSGYREKTGRAPLIIINSIDIDKIAGLFSAGDLPGVTEYLSDELQKLERAGATCGLIAANTPHLVFDDLQRSSKIPLISIVRATCDQAKSRGLRKVGLMGTRFTMGSDLYPKGLAEAGIVTVIPTAAERDYIHEKYMGELIKATFLPETREQLCEIVRRMKREDSVDGVILGGTELPLIFRTDGVEGIPLLDTSRIHVQAVVKYVCDGNLM
jgi:aspartate racemase